MDKQERGILLADQEELEKKIAATREKLLNMGTVWKNLSNAIVATPEKVNFHSTPPGIDHLLIASSDIPSFNWNEIPKIEVISKLIFELKVELEKLTDIRRSLCS